MVRLRHSKTGVIVDVSDDVAGVLEGYEPVQAPVPSRKASTKPVASKKK